MRIAAWIAKLISGGIGAVLLCATPLLLLLGGWAGADSNSMAGGLFNVVGVPWLAYALSTAGVMLLLRYQRPLLALVLSLLQLVPAIWIGSLLVH